MAPHSKGITNCIPEEIGKYLKEVAGVVNPHLARVRLAFGRGQGRLLRQLSDYAPKQLLERLLCTVHYGRLGEDVERKDRRPCHLQYKEHCRDSKESVILGANTPMTLPEKRSEEAEIRTHYSSVYLKPFTIRI